MNYQTNELQFELPEGCQDQSVNMFVTPRNGPGEFSFVISRQEIAPTQTLSGYVDGQLDKLAQALSGFRMLRREPAYLHYLPAEQAEFTWRSDGQPMHQHQTYVINQHMALTLTATTPEALFPKYQATLKRVLESMQFTR